jgi:hypothetical protein
MNKTINIHIFEKASINNIHDDNNPEDEYCRYEGLHPFSYYLEGN